MVRFPSMSTSILATKLFIPPPRPNAVPRPDVTRKLSSGLEQPGGIALVSAPGGFGKTTLLSQFTAQKRESGTSVAWLSLEAADNDLKRFWTYVVAACETVVEGIGEATAGVLESQTEPPTASIPTLLINTIAEKEDPILIVLDDYHAIHAQAIHESMLALIGHLPTNLSLVVSSRVDPPWPLARLRAGNRLTEIRVGDLRFAIQESTGFMKRTMGLDLSDETIAILEGRTEGWVAGLQLAALAIAQRGDVDAFLQEFSGSHAYVAEYLIEEVMAGRSEAARTFLLQTSILDRMNAELCDAVTGRDDSRVLLDTLLRSNAFLIPLDSQGQWYRYHHLFSDLLQVRLEQEMSAETIRDMHLCASSWFEANGYIFEAAKHAIEARNFDRVSAALLRHARELIYSGELNTLRGWLQAVPQSCYRNHPQLRFLLFWVDVLQNRADLSDSSLHEIETSLGTLPETPDNDRLHGELMAVICRAVAFSGRTNEAIRLAHKALSSLSPDDPASRARAYSAIAVSLSLEGRRDEATPAFESCRSQAIAAGDYRLYAHAMMTHGLVQFDEGRLHAAAESFRSILDLEHRAETTRPATPFLPSGQGHVGLGMVYLERNDLETAEYHLSRGIELCTLGGLDGTFVAHLQMARLHQARGNLDAAMDAVRALENDSPRVDEFGITDRKIRIVLADDDVDTAWALAGPFTHALLHGSIDSMPTLMREQIQIMVARVLVARKNWDSAIEMIDEILSAAEESSRIRRLIEGNILHSLIYWKRNEDLSEVVRGMVRAFELGEAEGFYRVFIEEGPEIIPLLEAVTTSATSPESVKGYAAMILEGFTRSAGTVELADADDATGTPTSGVSPSADRSAGAPAALVEQLSTRELEVLQLLAAGDTNLEIAETLFISVRTVKKHASNIYGKLSVSNRTQAVARARTLGLLSSE